MAIRTRATVDELYCVPENGKAELVEGEIVRMSPAGGLPGRAGGAIFFSLRLYENETRGGRAYPDNVGFLVDLPHRQSFSPDAAFFTGGDPEMQFPRGAPVFAAEVWSENDYGASAERAMKRKRDDYFAAGTEVVWDVDLQSRNVVRVYRRTDPLHPTIYRSGDLTEAEPAVPGWTMLVDDLFR